MRNCGQQSQTGIFVASCPSYVQQHDAVYAAGYDDVHSRTVVDTADCYDMHKMYVIGIVSRKISDQSCLVTATGVMNMGTAPSLTAMYLHSTGLVTDGMPPVQGATAIVRCGSSVGNGRMVLNISNLPVVKVP